jgi:hypothetical protein
MSRINQPLPRLINTLYLRCDKCGNSDRFFEFMERESHLIDGNLTYLHLREAVTHHYECCNCGEEVPVRERKVSL